ncbi:MAG: SDR family NAD(P)-dependent oxidoreductase [Chloroflexota bacterium]|nr:SDR family NAD(P)-dependent oxidoreductase [Chloroflexota bacterium]
MWKRRSSNPSPLRPERHVALITGASQGLGRAFAEHCARLGMDLILVALPESGLPRVARRIELLYDVRTHPVEMDLTVSGNPQALVRSISRQGRGVSMLINNAGVGYNSRFEDSTLRQNESCILLNNLARVEITRLLLPELKHHPRAFVLNVSSLAAFFPMPFMPVYGPSKTFILNFSLALRSEMRHTPVSVSALCPNGIRTNRECQHKIEAHGPIGSLVSMDPDEVVACAMNGLFAGKAIIVLGFLNQCLAALGRHVPRPIVCSVVSSFYGKTASRGTVAGKRGRGAVAIAPHPSPESRQCGQPVA